MNGNIRFWIMDIKIQKKTDQNRSVSGYFFYSVGAGCVGLMDSSQQLLQFIKPIIQYLILSYNHQISVHFSELFELL